MQHLIGEELEQLARRSVLNRLRLAQTDLGDGHDGDPLRSRCVQLAQGSVVELEAA